MLGLNGKGWVEINHLPESKNERGKGKKKSVDAKLSAISSLGMNVYIYKF